ncbi:hypothetical protein GIB67_030058 [Kingdonia uniflora]|uniref:BTB domain-containing protein n=1 Tax=Kingdonia uniflora TaxID=39325 RepID=A0A7J7MYD8_9MAGN|nr:hypothetical protein GIB67_030058 [Kingdonia uniflora]
MEKKFLTVAPFECAWLKELRFREAGRGCVAFEAFARNDVTVVFREHVGSQHYHYKRDTSPHYTVIIGSHRNRRLKIEVDGKTVVDEAGIGLCCSSAFQSYWISIYDGLISIGKGKHPFQNLVFQWLDTKPNCSVQYVGLSSWDKHVGYRNVNVMSFKQNQSSSLKHVISHDGNEGEVDDEDELEDRYEGHEEWGLLNFLESWELSDVFFVVGAEEKVVPAHKVILGASGSFPISSCNEDSIQLLGVDYLILHALLQYIYTGRTQILEPQLGSLRDLGIQFEVVSLVKQCEEILERFKGNKKLFESGKKVEILHPCSRPQRCAVFPFELPISVQRLTQILSTGDYCDLDIYIEGHGLVVRAHKLILSLWSIPFMKMFTNGMRESGSSEIFLSGVSLEAFEAMFQFMYHGDIDMKIFVDMGNLSIQLLLLADQFGIAPLHQECCNTILEYLSEDSVCSVLQVVTSIPSCKILEETCERKFSRHFDYCTTASSDFVLLDETTFRDILQHPDLTVTSEERILDAILLWGTHTNRLCGWQAVDAYVMSSTPDLLFGDRFLLLNTLLPLVRFPLMPLDLLKKLEKSILSIQIPVIGQLVTEAIQYLDTGMQQGNNQNVIYQHRRSSFKELQYLCDGDNNGVIYFAGTSYGEHQWVNPVLAKKISVTASSPPSRYTDPKALVSRAFQATSFAGPRIEDEKNCAWWMLDIGQDHQDGSNAFMRSWVLQGSLEGKNWTDLRVHEKDQTICKPGQFASWPIIGPTSVLPLRFFRVLLTGPTTSDSIPWNICICFLELYGYFHL